MKKSILAFAVLGAFAGAASAQSSVTIYGKLNLEVGKAAGSADKALMDVAGSRLGFRGVEDLGGGMKATFGIEHRFVPQTGAANANFWNGYSTVGLQGGFGWVRLGRDYTPAFLMIQNQIDPFGGDTVAALRDIGMRGQGGTTRVRASNMVEYHIGMSGFNLGAQIAEAAPNGGPKRPFSIAANYAAGPLFVGAGLENPAGLDDQHFSVGARYNFGFMTASAGFHKGTTNKAANGKTSDTKGFLLAASVPVGAGAVRGGYAQSTLGDADAQKKVSIGYRHDLSKRTYLFADLARVNDVISRTEKTGYDFGLQHNF
ncbi:porin [Ideonella sp.]|jgi:predicted porin|uniref:porin n=1 Tax=Ideonella sp. TaxID=1929293 RepID=UPI0037BEB37B